MAAASILMRPWSADSVCRNPTLSYTQRLEERIKELEDQLAAVPNKSVSAAESTHSSPSFLCSQDSQSYNRPSAEDQGVTRSFRSLKIDDDGVLTYHGAPSFFQLPVDQLAERGDSQPAAADNKRRTNLVSDAREQRFPENLSNIPVRPSRGQNDLEMLLVLMLIEMPGALPLSHQHSFLLGPASLPLHIPSSLHPSVDLRPLHLFNADPPSQAICIPWAHIIRTLS